MDTKKWLILGGALVIGALFVVGSFLLRERLTLGPAFHFVSDSSQAGVLRESGSMRTSKSADWWVNSGALMNIGTEDFSTNHGPLPKDDRMRKLYKKNNPQDTDDGYFPQNIFRLVNRHRYEDLSQQVYFSVDAINMSESENRAESNGVLLFNRYQDGDNLYYTGLRVDGIAVIKKKIDGKYYTLKQKRVLTEGGDYDRKNNPNLIPLHEWIGIKSEVVNDGDTAEIRLYMDEGQGWQLVLETHDTDDKYGKYPLLDAGYAGIRTDFMDVTFKEYSIGELD